MLQTSQLGLVQTPGVYGRADQESSMRHDHLGVEQLLLLAPGSVMGLDVGADRRPDDARNEEYRYPDAPLPAPALAHPPLIHRSPPRPGNQRTPDPRLEWPKGD